LAHLLQISLELFGFHKQQHVFHVRLFFLDSNMTTQANAGCHATRPR
jgi:hypothetical protein